MTEEHPPPRSPAGKHNRTRAGRGGGAVEVPREHPRGSEDASFARFWVDRVPRPQVEVPSKAAYGETVAETVARCDVRPVDLIFSTALVPWARVFSVASSAVVAVASP